jgi:uncharacterized membrane protein
MNRHVLAAFLLILAFLGLADSAYLAHAALTNTALVCNIAGLDGCNVVAQSAYSHIFGIPLGVYGVAFYGLLFILGAMLYVANRRSVYLGTIGLIASIIFMGLQLFVIKTLCVYCLGSAIISLLVFIVALWLLWKHAPKHGVMPPVVDANV